MIWSLSGSFQHHHNTQAQKAKEARKSDPLAQQVSGNCIMLIRGWLLVTVFGGLKVDLPDFRSFTMSSVHVRRHRYGFCIMPSFLETRLYLTYFQGQSLFPSLALLWPVGETEMKNTFLPYLKEWLYLYLTSTRPRSSSSLVKTRGRGLSWMTLSGYKSEKNGSVSKSKPLVKLGALTLRHSKSSKEMIGN